MKLWKCSISSFDHADIMCMMSWENLWALLRIFLSFMATGCQGNLLRPVGKSSANLWTRMRVRSLQDQVYSLRSSNQAEVTKAVHVRSSSKVTVDTYSQTEKKCAGPAIYSQCHLLELQKHYFGIAVLKPKPDRNWA